MDLMRSSARAAKNVWLSAKLVATFAALGVVNVVRRLRGLPKIDL